MFSTFILAIVFLIVTLLAIAVWGGLLYLGLRWAKVQRPSRGRLLAVVMLCQGLVPLVVMPLLLLLASHVLAPLALALLGLFLVTVLPVILVRAFFRLPTGRAIQAWLPTLLTAVLNGALVVGVVRPWVCEAFTVPSNSMAPTILGPHWTGVCERCGGATHGTPIDPANRRFLHELPTICQRCFHTQSDRQIGDSVEDGDRFLVSKFLAPRRWDVVVFQYPEDPSILYVKRLVGLPGETIVLAEGKVWANGQELVPPEELRGLAYVSAMPGSTAPLSGTREKPAVLGPDEYFVLGDFSQNARDSRLWQRGAPGHPPYAVPRSYLHGVVTHIYWPVSRMRIVR